MTQSVRKDILSGVKWNSIGQFGRQVLSFAVMIILTRLLTPVEFGKIGVLAMFISVADVLVKSGMGVALIQKQSKSSEDYSTVFVFNVVVGVLIYLILFFAAPFIATFFDEPELMTLTRVVSLVFVINSFGTVQSTILQINLKFKKQNLISLMAVFGSAGVAIFMALSDFGVYALAGQVLSFALISTVALTISSAWKPNLYFSRNRFKSLFRMGGRIMVSSLLDQIFVSIDNLIIGKVFSISQLGLYSRAKSVRDLPVLNTTGIISAIYFPIFSKIDEESRLRSYQLQFFGIISYVIFPVMTGLYIVSEPFVRVVFTEKWISLVPMLQIFCVYGALYPLSVILVQSMIIRGESKKFLELDVLKKIVLVVAMVIGVYFGVYPFLIALCLANYFCFGLNIYYSSRVMKVGMISYLKTMLPSLLISLLMGAGVYVVGLISVFNDEMRLVCQVGVGILSYIVLSSVFKLKEFQYLIELIFKRQNS